MTLTISNPSLVSRILYKASKHSVMSDKPIELSGLRVTKAPRVIMTPDDITPLPQYPCGIRLVSMTDSLVPSILLSALDSTIISTAIRVLRRNSAVSVT
jgi:hypothetical protein